MKKYRRILGLMSALLMGCLPAAFGQLDQTKPDENKYYTDYERFIKKIEDQVTGVDLHTFNTVKKNINQVGENKKIKLVLPPPAKHTLTPEALFEQRSGVVMVVGTYYNCGQCHKMHAALNASAMVLNEDGVCATNYHVLAALGLGGADTVKREEYMYLADIKGNIFPIAEVLTWSKDADLVIFKINTKGKKLSAVSLGESAKVGSTVHSITHPQGQQLYYYSRGYVARNVSNAMVGPQGDRMQVTCDYSVGSSGGPIFDDRGNLVGMVSMTNSVYGLPNDPMTLQMVLRSTIPVSTIKSLIM